MEASSGESEVIAEWFAQLCACRAAKFALNEISQKLGARLGPGKFFVPTTISKFGPPCMIDVSKHPGGEYRVSFDALKTVSP